MQFECKVISLLPNDTSLDPFRDGSAGRLHNSWLRLIAGWFHCRGVFLFLSCFWHCWMRSWQLFNMLAKDGWCDHQLLNRQDQKYRLPGSVNYSPNRIKAFNCNQTLVYSAWLLKEIKCSDKYIDLLISLSFCLLNISIKFKQTDLKSRTELISYTELLEYLNWVFTSRFSWNLS